MFIFQSKKIHLDCFTHSHVMATDNPIAKSSKFLPNWWKSLPNSIDVESNNLITKSPTMKGCLGIIDLYQTGVILPLWSDLALKISDNRIDYKFVSDAGKIASHNPNQHGNKYSRYTHCKIIVPWILKEKSGVKFLMTACLWELLEHAPNLKILSGVLDFKVQHQCNINAFVPRERIPYQYDLLAGLPLVQLIPLSDKKLVTHIHVLDDVEYKKMMNDYSSYKFINWGLNRRKILNGKN